RGLRRGAARRRGRAAARRDPGQAHASFGVALAVRGPRHRPALGERTVRAAAGRGALTVQVVLRHRVDVPVGGVHQLVGGLVDLVALLLVRLDVLLVGGRGHLARGDLLLLGLQLLLGGVELAVPVHHLVDQLGAVLGELSALELVLLPQLLVPGGLLVVLGLRRLARCDGLLRLLELLLALVDRDPALEHPFGLLGRVVVLPVVVVLVVVLVTRGCARPRVRELARGQQGHLGGGPLRASAVAAQPCTLVGVEVGQLRRVLAIAHGQQGGDGLPVLGGRLRGALGALLRTLLAGGPVGDLAGGVAHQLLDRLAGVAVDLAVGGVAGDLDRPLHQAPHVLAAVLAVVTAVAAVVAVVLQRRFDPLGHRALQLGRGALRLLPGGRLVRPLPAALVLGEVLRQPGRLLDALLDALRLLVGVGRVTDEVGEHLLGRVPVVGGAGSLLSATVGAVLPIGALGLRLPRPLGQLADHAP